MLPHEPSRIMKIGIIRGFVAGVLATAMVAMSGCGARSHDEDREAAFLPQYEAAVTAERYCEALEVTATRFDYADTGRLQPAVAKRIMEWQPRIEAAKVGCARERWPARETELKAQIKDTQDKQALYESLDKLSLQLVAGSWREDGRGQLCLIDVLARNGSDQSISKFTLSAEPAEDHGVEASVGPLDPALAPGEARKIVACADRIDVHPYMNASSIPAMPLYATVVTTDDGRTAKLADWRRQDEDTRFPEAAAALQAQLTSENPFK